MSILSDKLKSGIVVDKEMAVVNYDFDGNVVSIEKIEYIDNKFYQTFLLKDKNRKDKEQLAKNNEYQNEITLKNNEKKKQTKRDVLQAFAYWYRDVTNGILSFDNSVYESVIYWYREYLNNNTIEIHKELDKYL